jgi:hypothetical protein
LQRPLNSMEPKSSSNPIILIPTEWEMIKH